MANNDNAVTVISGERNRDGSGRYEVERRCDACCKPLTVATGGHLTDDEVCRGDDGPGFFVCGRSRCGTKRDALDVAGRRALYTTGRAKNDAE